MPSSELLSSSFSDINCFWWVIISTLFEKLCSSCIDRKELELCVQLSYWKKKNEASLNRDALIGRFLLPDCRVFYFPQKKKKIVHGFNVRTAVIANTRRESGQLKKKIKLKKNLTSAFCQDHRRRLTCGKNWGALLLLRMFECVARAPAFLSGSLLSWLIYFSNWARRVSLKILARRQNASSTERNWPTFLNNNS